jgi:hypothetical protein
LFQESSNLFAARKYVEQLRTLLSRTKLIFARPATDEKLNSPVTGFLPFPAPLSAV